MRAVAHVPANKERIGCVCFDVGGVLVRTTHGWTEACRSIGLDVRGPSGGDAARRLRQELTHQLGTGRMTEREWAERLESALGRLYDADELVRIHQAVIQREYDGALELIEALNAAGIATACLSNTNAAHWVRLLHHDGDSPRDGDPEYPSLLRLRHPHASHLLGVAKPDLAIYRAFEKSTGFIGARILFFDDVIENVEAARSLGWRAERIDYKTETIPQMRRLLRSYQVL